MKFFQIAFCKPSGGCTARIAVGGCQLEAKAALVHDKRQCSVVFSRKKLTFFGMTGSVLQQSLLQRSVACDDPDGGIGFIEGDDGNATFFGNCGPHKK